MRTMTSLTSTHSWNADHTPTTLSSCAPHFFICPGPPYLNTLARTHDTDDSTLDFIRGTLSDDSDTSFQLSIDECPVTSEEPFFFWYFTIIPAVEGTELTDGSLELTFRKRFTLKKGMSYADMSEDLSTQMKKTANDYKGKVQTVSFDTYASMKCWGALVDPTIPVDVYDIDKNVNIVEISSAFTSPKPLSVTEIVGAAMVVAGMVAF